MLNSFKTIFGIFLSVFFIAGGVRGFEKLPNCKENSTPGLAIVSTLDGVISAINANGELEWQFDTGPGPLLSSNIHNLELTKTGQWARIIPSLTGSLYHFDGESIYPLPMRASTLLSSSLKYSDDLVFAGGVDVRTYSLSFRTGKLFYTCSSLNCINTTNTGSDLDDILLIERTTQTVRAIEVRSGYERWNFSVATHNISLPRISCSDPSANLFTWNISAIVPNGILIANSTYGTIPESWKYEFNSPIVRIWKWNGHILSEVDLFKLRSDKSFKELQITPSIYLGMHDKQLYIHESLEQQNQMQSISKGGNTNLAEIPWKPIPASDNETEDDSTAISVLYSSAYVNGQGYYFYNEKDHKHLTNGRCEHNRTLKFPALAGAFIDGTFNEIVSSWWMAALVVLTTTVLVFNVTCRQLIRTKKEDGIIFVEQHVEVPIPNEDPPKFQSRYLNDFVTLRCLGQGGFGVVFEVKQNIDECKYAIKRTTLPSEGNKRDTVMREVKALAKLEHAHIVRYYNSWVETPPLGWQQEHDTKWINGELDSEFTTYDENQEDFPSSTGRPVIDLVDESEGSSIVFAHSNAGNITTSRSQAASISSIVTASPEDTQSSAVNWRRPSRRYHVTNPETRKDFLYIQMQLCQKHSLKEWLKDNAERDKNVVLDMFKQILSAVSYIHLQGLIHRDLKPSNIFFAMDGQIKVGDFGLVKDEEESHDSTNSPSHNKGHTREVGTQLYMSPEQLKGQKYNYKIDIFSLGVIFFELLVYFGTDMERFRTITNIKNNVFPKEFIAKYPSEHKLLTLMLSESPDKRLSALEVSEQLN